jgi:hypothetical protein
MDAVRACAENDRRRVHNISIGSAYMWDWATEVLEARR